MQDKRSVIISVIGGGQVAPEDEAWALGEQVGRELAKRGAIVACGGLKGIMEAACKGAKEAGGTTIGILPGSDPKVANQYVDIPICTGIGYARNSIVVLTGRAVIAVDGAYGTLSEIGHALGSDVPLIGLDTWTLSRKGSVDESIILAKDPADAVEKALEEARKRDAQFAV
jgi:uncharacterized protein (TIGR00725 family)